LLLGMDTLLFISIAEAAAETHSAAESGGISALGLDGRAILFQLLNFAILLGLLRAFAYKPIVAILEERRRTIAESLRNAETIAATKAQLAAEQQAVLARARAEAAQLVEQGKERSSALISAAEQAAGERAAQLVSQAEARIENEVATARQGLRAEAVNLVAAATEKMIDTKLDVKADVALITKAVESVQ
jgi:F-type H+-transporting ATPase subunit b